MNNQNTFIHLEDLGNTTQLQVNGYGSDLVNLVAQAAHGSSELRQVLEMALISVYEFEIKNATSPQRNEELFVEMLKSLNISLS